MNINLEDLLNAGCHFGHQKTRRYPKMGEYVFGVRNNVEVIDLAKTKVGLEEAAQEIGQMTNKDIIFVATRKNIARFVKEIAEKAGIFYVINRWPGGLISNWSEIKKNLDKMRQIEETLQVEEKKAVTEQKQEVNQQRKSDVREGKKEVGEKSKDNLFIAKAKDITALTKKEKIALTRELVKLKELYGGIAQMVELPKTIVVFSVRDEESICKEARNRGIKIIGICDTNANPDFADIVIPANDDAVEGIKYIAEYLAKSVK